MIGKTNAASGGGFKPENIGDITLTDKSKDSNFTLCNGTAFNPSMYPQISHMMPTDKNTLGISTSWKIIFNDTHRITKVCYFRDKYYLATQFNNNETYELYSSDNGLDNFVKVADLPQEVTDDMLGYQQYRAIMPIAIEEFNNKLYLFIYSDAHRNSSFYHQYNSVFEWDGNTPVTWNKVFEFPKFQSYLTNDKGLFKIEGIDGKLFAATGTGFYVTIDGKTFVRKISSTGQNLDYAYDEKRNILLIMSNGSMWQSYDKGNSFVQQGNFSSIQSHAKGVTYNGEVFLSMNSSNTDDKINESSDGITWAYSTNYLAPYDDNVDTGLYIEYIDGVYFCGWEDYLQKYSIQRSLDCKTWIYVLNTSYASCYMFKVKDNLYADRDAGYQLAGCSMLKVLPNYSKPAYIKTK